MKIYLLLLLGSLSLSAQSFLEDVGGVQPLPYNHPRAALCNNPSLFTDYQSLVRSYYAAASTIPDWQAQALSFSYRHKAKNYGIGLFRSGLPNYQSLALQLAIGIKVHSHWNLGIQSTARRLELVEQDARHQFRQSLFLSYKGKNKFHWTQAWHWQKISAKIPISWDTELCFQTEAHWDVYLNLSLWADGRSNLGLCSEYALVPQCLVRQSISYQNSWNYRSALEFRWKQWALIGDFQWQKYLGSQLGIGLSYGGI